VATAAAAAAAAVAVATVIGTKIRLDILSRRSTQYLYESGGYSIGYAPRAILILDVIF